MNDAAGNRESAAASRSTHHSGVGAWVDHHVYSLVASLGRFLGKPWSSALTVGVMAVALALPLGLWLVLGNVARFSGQVQQSREIGVFLKHDVDAARASALADTLRGRNDVAKVDWGHHLPTMYRFWESLLFGSGGYQGNPFLKHVSLPVQGEHFQRWLSLFLATVDQLFTGTKAEEAKTRALMIADVFQRRMGLVQADAHPTTCLLSS